MTRAGPQRRSAPGAAGASCASARRSTRSGWKRCCGPARASTPCSPPTPTARARRDSLLGRALGGGAARGLLPGRRGRPRLLRGRARRAAGLSPLHRSAAARPGRSTPAYLRMAAERSLERLGASSFDLLLLHNPDRIGYTSEAVWDGMAALREAGLTARDRRRPGAGQRLHARPDRLPGALRRPDRLGDDHPQPVRALAGRALPRRRRAARRQGDHPRRRLRRPLLGRPAAGHGAGPGRPPRLPARRLDRGRAGEARAGPADRRAGRADPDPARLPVEPRPSGGRVRRPDPDPGGRHPEARPIEDKRAELAALPAEQRLIAADVA